MEIEKLDFAKGGGLITVVVQDIESKDVLMVAWANKEAVEKTIEIGLATFKSRSRPEEELWIKGLTSGNIMKVKEIWRDCDGDTLIFFVEPTGPACHNGTRTCFETVLWTSTKQENT